MKLVCLYLLEFFLIKWKLQNFPVNKSDRVNSDTDTIKESDVMLRRKIRMAITSVYNVPQKSFLGPLFFKIYIINLPQVSNF